MPPPTLRDADDTIVLSDLVRTGEASRLRRRGAIRSNHQRVASVGANTTTSSRVLYRLFCRGGESEGEGQWSHEPFRQELFSGSNNSNGKQSLGVGRGGCGALVHLSATSDPDSTSYTSKSRPATIVVPLDAVYFRDQRPTATRTTTLEDVRSPYPPSSMYSTEVEYFEQTEIKRPEGPFADDGDGTLDSCVLSKNPCGCITEGVGCQSCGTPLGTRFIPCRAARHSSSHHHHHRSRNTMTASDFTFSRLQEDEGADEHVEYTFFGDAVDAVACPGRTPEEPQTQDSDTELDSESMNTITGRWGRRTSVWMPSDRPPRPRPHSYLSSASASTFSLLESRDTRDILADFLRRTGRSTSTVYVPPPPPPPRTRPRPIPRRSTRIGEAEMEASLRRASAVVVEGVDSMTAPTPIPSSPIFIPPEERESTTPTSVLATPPAPGESELEDPVGLEFSPAAAPTSAPPETEDLDQGLDLPFPFPEDDDPEVTRALGLPWVGFMGTPDEEAPGFDLGVLFDGDGDSDEESQEEDVVVPLVEGDEIDEASSPHPDVDASEPEEDEEEWMAMMPALRPVSETEDEGTDEGEGSDSDSDREREGDENIPPPSMAARMMERSALRRHTLPTPPTPPMIPYVPHPGGTWSVDWDSPYSMLSRSVVYNPDMAAASIARRRRPPPFMERSYGSMGRLGEDEDEVEGDDEREEEEGSKGGAGVLFAM